LKIAKTGNPVYFIEVLMSTVKFIIEHMVEKGNDTDCQSNTQTKNIDQGKDLVLP